MMDSQSVGVRQEIDDRVAIKFSVAFYETLGMGESVDFAYEVACKSMIVEGCPEDWRPILKRKTHSLRNKNHAQELILKDPSDGKTDAEQSETVAVKIKIDRTFDTYTEKEQERFLTAIGRHLEIDGDVRITDKRKGCVELTIELPLHKAQKLCDLVESGELKEYDVINAELITNLESDVTSLPLDQNAKETKGNLYPTVDEIYGRNDDQHPDFNQSIAVIIGIDNYRNGITTLQTAVHDATTVGRILEEKHGYSPILLLCNEEATKEGIEDCLSELPDLVGEHDRLLFYFAGHGIAVNDEKKPTGYLIPQDAKRNETCSYLSMQCVHDALVRLNCRHMLAILDCCFAGSFRWVSTREVVDAPEKIFYERYHKYIDTPAWQVLTSSAHNQKAQDLLIDEFKIGRREDSSLNGNLRHSPFAAALIKILASGKSDYGNDGVITATELYIYLRKQVENQPTTFSSNRQTPGLWPLSKHGSGEYTFVFPEVISKLPKAEKLHKHNNPYRGLESYREEDHQLFFGRAVQTNELFEKIQKQAFTNVIGMSGSGKSSLVMAGLLPTIRNQLSSKWAIWGPMRPGESPIHVLYELCRSNSPDTPIATSSQDVEVDSETLFATVDQWLLTNSEKIICLVIDQLEEIFTQCRNTDTRNQFLTILSKLLAKYQDHLRIVSTLRSDFEPQFYDAVQKLDENTLSKPESRFLVKQMSQDELRQIIEKPASTRVLFFESNDSDEANLVDQLINEVVQMPGALPLLSFTLSELYLQYVRSGRTDRTLRKEDFRKFGGITGALRHRAEELTPNDPLLLNTMRNVLLRMVSVEGREFTRRRVSPEELHYSDDSTNERVEEILANLIDGRLIVAAKSEVQTYVLNSEDSNSSSPSYYEPAHDALIPAWPQLTEWINEESTRDDNLQYQRRLTQAARDWRNGANQSSLNQDNFGRFVRVFRELTVKPYDVLSTLNQESALWTGDENSTLLYNILNETNGKRNWLNEDETNFAKASIEKTEKNLELRNRIFRTLFRLFAAAVIAAILFLIAGVVANNERQEADANLIQQLREASQRLSNTLQTQLTIDPVASLHLGILALPDEGNVRPYIPDAERGLNQAIRTSLERQYHPLSHEPLLPSRVAYGADWIAVGGTALSLVDYSLTDVVTITNHSEEAFDILWLDDHTLLRWGAQEVQVWRDRNLLFAEQFGSSGKIACAMPSPTTEEIAICHDKTIWIWTPSQNSLSQLPELPGRVLGARWSPEERQLAIWDESRSLTVWDSDRNQALELPALDEPSHIWDTAWVDKGRYLVAAMNDGFARIYDIQDPEQSTQIPIDKGRSRIQHVADDRFLIWTVGGRARLWSVRQEAPLAEYGLEESKAEDLMLFREESALLLMLSDNSAQFYPSLAITESITLRGHTGRVLSADLHGEHIATSSTDGSVRVWTTDRGAELMTLEGHTSQIFEERADVWGVHWLDDQFLFTHGEDGSVRRWQIFDEKGDPLCRGYQSNVPRCFDPNSTYKGHTGEIQSIRWLDNETFMTTSRDNSARRWDLSTNVSKTLTHTFGTTVEWDPSGTFVLGFIEEGFLSENDDPDGIVRRFDNGEIITRIPGPISAAFWLNVGIVTIDGTNTVRVIDPMNGQITREFSGAASQITAVAEHSDGSIATGEVNGTIRIWRPESDHESLILNASLPIEEQYVIAGIEWSRDGQRLLTFGAKLILWDLPNQTPLWESIDTDFQNNKATFSPDEQYIAFKVDKSLHVINAVDGTIMWSDERSHDQAIRGVEWVISSPWKNQELTWISFSYWRNRLFPREETRFLLLTWSDDDTARLWDGAAGKEIMRMTELGNVSAAAINPSGDTIVTATILYEKGPEGLIHTWRTWHNDHEELLEQADSMTTRLLSDEQKLELIGQSQQP